MSEKDQVTAPVAGGGVLDMERDARTIYDIACIRESAKSATREDVEFKAIALRNFNSASAVAELVSAADRALRQRWATTSIRTPIDVRPTRSMCA